MGSTMIEGDLRVDKLLSLVQDGEGSGNEDVGVRCLVGGRRFVYREDEDPQYKLFLRDLRVYGGSYAFEVVREDGVSEMIRYHQEDGLPRRIVRRGISDEDVDPQYKLFLESLREDGNSYAFEAVQENGFSEVIRYHKDGFRRRRKRRCISDEDVDPQYKLFSESLREDGNSYAFEAVQENGYSEVIRYHKDGFRRRRKRRCISDEDVDPQYKLFSESLREDGNSYAFEAVQDNGFSEVIRYHKDGFRRGSKRRCISDENVAPQYKLLLENLSIDGNDENKHFGDDNSEIRSEDDSYNEHGLSIDEFSDVRSAEDDANGNEHSGDSNIDAKSVQDGDNWNEQSSDDNVHVKSLDDDVRDLKSLYLENLREDENTFAQEIDQETGNLEQIRYHQIDEFLNEATLVATEPMKNSLVKDMTETEHRHTLESLKDLPKRKSSVVKKNAESAALSPGTDIENMDSSKRPCLEVHTNPEELNSGTLGTWGSPEEELGIANRDLLQFSEEELQRKKSEKNKNAKLGILNPVASRTRGKSSKSPHLEVHNTPESCTNSPLKEKRETKGTWRHMKKETAKIKKINKSAHLLNKKEGLKNLRNERSESLHILEDLHLLEKKCSGGKKNVKEAAEYPYADRTNEIFNKRVKRPGSEALHFANCGCNSFAKCNRNGVNETDLTDESYQDFLSSSEINDENMTYAPQNGSPVTYDLEIKDENADSSSDSDLVVLERDPAVQCHTPIKLDSNFREGLMKDLKRPYDQKEYMKLSEDWTNQMPARGHAKNFRSGVIKMYALEGEYGTPYKNLYPDLAEMIKVSDRPRRLSLLRGFFYWLKNVAEDKLFEPWTDEECLNVVPQL